MSNIVNCVIKEKPVSPSTPPDVDKLLVRNPLSPPPPTLVEYIVGSNNVPLELAILFSGLQGAHHRVAASLSLLVDVNAMCINSNITSNIFLVLTI